MSWPKILKNRRFEVSSFIVHKNNEPFLRLWCLMKSGFYMTTSYDQISGWTEKKPQSTSQSQTCTKKQVMVTGGLLPVWSTIVFWTPAKPLHLRSMLSKSMRCTKNCQRRSRHWSTEWAQLFSTPTPNCVAHNHTWKVERTGLQSCASSAIFTWPLANQQPLLSASWQLFAGKRLPQPAGSRKCFSRVHQILKHRYFMLQE